MNMSYLNRLRATGRIRWDATEQAWLAEPDEVISALGQEGFEECKRDVVRSRRDREPAGGIWQGLNTTTGAVASAVWVKTVASRDALLFIDVDGRRISA
jgi:hypothetical protein